MRQQMSAKKRSLIIFISLKVEVNDCDIDRADRIGKKKSNDGVVTQQIIVKFRYFTKHTQYIEQDCNPVQLKYIWI